MSVDIGESETSALKPIGQLLVIDSQLMQNRRLQITLNALASFLIPLS